MKLPARIGAVEFDEDDIRIAVVNTGGRTPSIVTGVRAVRSMRARANGSRRWWRRWGMPGRS